MTKDQVKDIRKRIGLSQKEFAKRYRLNHRTLAGWERSKRPLDTATAALLTIIDRKPIEAALALMPPI
jgi:DNA-binding transcriptional regulator YiaG